MRIVIALTFAVALSSAACREDMRKQPLELNPDAAPGPDAPFVAGHVIVTTAGKPLSDETLGKYSLVKDRDLSFGAAIYRIDGLNPRSPGAREKTLAVVDALKKEPGVKSAEVEAIVVAQ